MVLWGKISRCFAEDYREPTVPLEDRTQSSAKRREIRQQRISDPCECRKKSSAKRREIKSAKNLQTVVGVVVVVIFAVDTVLCVAS